MVAQGVVRASYPARNQLKASTWLCLISGLWTLAALGAPGARANGDGFEKLLKTSIGGVGCWSGKGSLDDRVGSPCDATRSLCRMARTALLDSSGPQGWKALSTTLRGMARGETYRYPVIMLTAMIGDARMLPSLKELAAYETQAKIPYPYGRFAWQRVQTGTCEKGYPSYANEVCMSHDPWLAKLREFNSRDSR